MKIRSGFIAIVGKPNAGKSTLVNALVKEKVSIVSPKQQTTRNNVLGILNGTGHQLVFVDTPGSNTAKTKLDSFMQKGIKGAVAGVDVIILAVDGTKKWTDEDREMVDRYAKDAPLILAITKIDLVKKADLFIKLSELNNLEKVRDIIPVSSLKNQNLDKLIEQLLKYVPEIDEKDRYFDDDLYTDKSLRFIVGEIVREKSLYFLDKEIPHGIAVAIEKYEEGEKLTTIDAAIICEKDSHKGIIIGRHGSMLKKIGHASRVSIQKVVRSKVDLHLFVKVKEGWRNDPAFLAEIGYNEKEI
ncbi:MAG: GTPase Era [Christensenellaceae bacterium]|jgi:GTP-binding protein Era|nr:GTPase Era [Christensenellaceae bacterium]